MNFKFATWNLNSIKTRISHLLQFISEHDPDVICLQELKCDNNLFPYDAFSHLPYNLYVNGQKSYNGVAIFSKFVADEVKIDFPSNPAPDQARFIEITFNNPVLGFVRAISLYAPNGGAVDSDKFQLKLKFYKQFIDYIKSINSFDEKLLIGSDYNIAPFDIDVYDPEDLKNTTCFTYAEREKMRTLLNCGLVDNFRILHPHKNEFTWWDYRAGAFEQNKGLRIDGILSSYNALPFLDSCIINYNARTMTQPSDHAPVMSIFGS